MGAAVRRCGGVGVGRWGSGRSGAVFPYRLCQPKVIGEPDGSLAGSVVTARVPQARLWRDHCDLFVKGEVCHDPVDPLIY